jgi:thiol-disulfide isomerase/thioredoxin
MLRKFSIIACLFISARAAAQVSITPIKTTENPQIDYKQMDAPMPPLLFIPYHDTTAKPAASNEESARERRKRMRNAGSVKEKQLMTEKDFNNGANLFVVMFNPTCSHCMDETKALEKSSALFKKSKVVMVATKAMRPYVADFVKSMQTADYPFIYVGVDSTNFVDNVFLYQSLPQINIYNGDRKLMKTFTGDVAIDTLQKFIQ